jgi:16S rRNA (adenine1518-N6/adenine1519-N6)-dimethyltransferase
MSEISVKELVQIYNLAPNKKLGQNFLFDEDILSEIADKAPNIKDQVVIEIGPGPGGLTKQIMKRNPQKLFAIEMDDRCLKALRHIEDPRLEVVLGDALKLDYSKFGSKNMQVIANLPYNIATELYFIFLENRHLFGNMTLMFQKEVAERIEAKPKTKAYGRVSILSQAFCDVSIEMILPPEYFFPAPKIDSAVINISPIEDKNKDVDYAKLSKICNVLFAERRKMINKAMKRLFAEPEKIAEKLGIKLTSRAEELTVDEFCALAREEIL